MVREGGVGKTAFARARRAAAISIALLERALASAILFALSTATKQSMRFRSYLSINHTRTDQLKHCAYLALVQYAKRRRPYKQKCWA